jgi:hypothetical protein
MALYPAAAVVAGDPVQTANNIVSFIQANPNQPEADDGVVFSNGTAASYTAEVVYFVRGGNLYRRVLLLREPLDPTYDRQPFDSAANNYFNYTLSASYPSGSDFYRDFDFSARYSATGAIFLGSGGTSLTLDPLDNGTAGGSYPIAVPFNRFGHDPDSANANTSGSSLTPAIPNSVGNPREYVFDNAGNANQIFIGRFTHEETSNPNFNYPHSAAIVGGSPVNPLSQGVALHLNTANTVTEFSGVPTNSRRGEDILLSNVHGLDVQVWDDIIGDYVDIGHALTNGGIVGDFNQGRNLRPTYGPQITLATNRMFDTWHPSFDANWSASGASADATDYPPFAPRYDYRASGDATAANGIWTATTTYKIGDVVIPSTANGLAYRANSITIAGSPSNTGASGGSEPAWSTVVGDPTGPDGDITWQTIPNVKRIKSLKITIRYLDVSTDQMRQVTLIQSLLD